MMTADPPGDNTVVGEWETFQEQLLSDPEARKEYERTFHAAVAFHEALQRQDTDAQLGHECGNDSGCQG